MKSFKALIVDDELHNREQLVRLLESYCPSISVVGVAASASEAQQMIRLIRPEVIFLDIEMPGGTGFDLLKNLNTIDFRIIFVTAYHSHALKAIKFSALDYILKPIDVDELKLAVSKLGHGAYGNEKIETLRSNLTIGSRRKVALHTQEEIHFVELSEIVRLEASANYTEVYLLSDQKLLLSRNLGYYEKLLNEDRFFRSHQSHLVNLEFVAKYVKTEGGYLLMEDQTVIPVSRLKKEELKNLF